MKMLPEVTEVDVDSAAVLEAWLERSPFIVVAGHCGSARQG